jgi:hypothetical protein
MDDMSDFVEYSNTIYLIQKQQEPFYILFRLIKTANMIERSLTHEKTHDGPLALLHTYAIGTTFRLRCRECREPHG